MTPSRLPGLQRIWVGSAGGSSGSVTPAGRSASRITVRIDRPSTHGSSSAIRAP